MSLIDFFAIATCYLNSLLQALYMLPEFRRALYQFEYSPDQHGEEAQCLTRQLQKLFVMLQLSVRGAVETSGLTKSFGWSGSESFQQQDVNECLAVLFDFMVSQCAGSQLADFICNKWGSGVCFDGLTCHSCGESRGSSNSFR